MRFISNLVLIISFHFTLVFALSVNFPQTATEGQSFSISFSGEDATTPFSLLLLPLFSSNPQVISIPDNAWSGPSSTGSFTTNVPFPAGTRFLAVLQDRKGRGTGVVSDLFTTASAGSGVCRRPQPAANVFSVVPSNPHQCSTETLSWKIPSNFLPPSGRQYSANMTAYVPRGQVFTLGNIVTSSADARARWVTNVPSGTRFLFLFEYDSGSGATIRETGPLQTSQSPLPGVQNCLGAGGPNLIVEAAPGNKAAGGNVITTDRLLLIAIGVGVFGVVLIIGAVLIFLYRRRLQRLFRPSEKEGSSGRSTTPPMSSVAFTSPSVRDDPFSDLNAVKSNTTKTYQGRPSSPSNGSNFLQTLRPGRRALLSIASFGNRGSLPVSRRNTRNGLGELVNEGNSRLDQPTLERNRGYDVNGNRANVKIPYLDLDRGKNYTTRPNRI